jgi:hypothetical protein
VLPRQWAGRQVADVFADHADVTSMAQVSASGRLKVEAVLNKLPVALLELR